MNFETFLESADTEVKLGDFHKFSDLKGVTSFKPTSEGSDSKKHVQGFWVLWHDKNEDDWNVSHVGLIKQKGSLLLDKVSPTPEFTGTKSEATAALAKKK